MHTTQHTKYPEKIKGRQRFGEKLLGPVELRLQNINFAIKNLKGELRLNQVPRPIRTVLYPGAQHKTKPGDLKSCACGSMRFSVQSHTMAFFLVVFFHLRIENNLSVSVISHFL